MHQEQCTLDLGAEPVESPLQLGASRWKGNWQVRNFKGFHQSREGGTGSWRFYIYSFDGTETGVAGRCTLLLASGGYEDVPIDALDRITIDGRRYDRKHWNH